MTALQKMFLPQSTQRVLKIVCVEVQHLHEDSQNSFVYFVPFVLKRVFSVDSSVYYDMKELFRVRTVAHIDAVVYGVPCNLAGFFQPDSKSVLDDNRLYRK